MESLGNRFDISNRTMNEAGAVSWYQDSGCLNVALPEVFKVKSSSFLEDVGSICIHFPCHQREQRALECAVFCCRGNTCCICHVFYKVCSRALLYPQEGKRELIYSFLHDHTLTSGSSSKPESNSFSFSGISSSFTQRALFKSCSKFCGKSQCRV